MQLQSANVLNEELELRIGTERDPQKVMVVLRCITLQPICRV
jgi:hypothetical protein